MLQRVKGAACFLLVFLITSISVRPSAAQTLVETDFNKATSLKSWRSFHPRTKPNVSIYQGSLLGERSASSGLTALSLDFAKSQERIAIEFSLGFSPSPGRTFHIWTHEPKGKDASQLNLCIQNGTLQHFDGRIRKWRILTSKIRSSLDRDEPVWHRIRLVVDHQQNGVLIFVSKPGELSLPAKPTVRAATYRNDLSIAGLSFVSGTRIASGTWYRVDDLKITGGSKNIESPGQAPDISKPFRLWTGKPIPKDPKDIPWVENVRNSTIHQPSKDEPKFLHGAAIVEHKGKLYANWANSPTNENGPHETLRGKSSTDGGRTWSAIETIAPGFEGLERHSHGVLFSHKEKLWTICSRFGIGIVGKRFDGLTAEAFVLDEENRKWKSKGIVMKNCWPYDQPVRMKNGNYITGGQDRNGHPVVAISNQDDFLSWRSVLIPFSPEMKPGFAETTVWAEQNNVLAIIRGGGGVAWIAKSKDAGETWSTAQPTNFPMPRSKAYIGKLSTGQLYLLSNYRNRDTLCISVGQPGKQTFDRIYRIRDGKSFAPRYPGKAKSKQWSYPYGYEYQGKLYVVYSVGKEECGLSVFDVESLKDAPSKND